MRIPAISGELLSSHSKHLELGFLPPADQIVTKTTTIISRSNTGLIGFSLPGGVAVEHVVFSTFV